MELYTELLSGAISLEVALAKFIKYCIENNLDCEWAQTETEGYPEDADLPTYRKVVGEIFIDYQNGAGIIQNHKIDLSSVGGGVHKSLTMLEVFESVSNLVKIAQNDKLNYTQRLNPSEFAGMLKSFGAVVYGNFVILNAEVRIKTINLQPVLEGIRTRLLKELKNLPNYLLAPNKSEVETITNLLSRFDKFLLAVKSTLKKTFTLEIQNEYDVQAITYGLLKVHFKDVDSENPTDKNGGGFAIRDFTINGGKYIVETKMTRKDLADKKLYEELVIDKARYEKADLVNFFVLIYDKGRFIKDKEKLEEDLCRLSAKIKVFIID